ncbi:TonB-dependent receptor [Novosphingobium olei]|uniref:TonB-dependent receptor n=1 Tax=Novosphingobium olei TaxID=2728851 RepID=A0A7Y0GBN7_9SPHN|nr:TonB-dependent receptor [Novosphingobium olei]NML94822.1 TonB-dependent receptor [Novosphingobium olei]BEV00306.1 TonB-dependent receptor [Novosphingobium olei]
MNKHAITAGRIGGSLLALSVALVAAPAFAQAAPQADAAAPADDGAIVVTGIRASLNAAAAIKRTSPAIVEAVSAEDIGKLPDVSIADSLARLPGVTSQRLEGRDQRLSIRGLGPDFSTTLLNGREQVTVGDNRGVEYDQYPSEFFKNVVVHKAADPSLIAAGIAGTVDLRMLRPLAQQDRIVALQLRGQMNGIKKLNPDGSRYGYRASAAYVDKFADDTFGIAIGVSATDAPSQNERYNAWGFPNSTATGGALLLGGAKPYVQTNKLQRYGAVATLEYQPSDNFHSTLDVLYSKFKETQRLRGIEFPIAPDWGSGATVQPGYTVDNGLVTDATITGVHAVQRNDYNKRDADNFSVGWNNVIGIGEKTHLTVDASYSHAKRTDFLLETYTGTGYGATGASDTLHISANKNGTFDIVPTLNYADSSLFGITDPRGWGYNGTTAVVQAGFLNRPSFKDDLFALRASLDGEFEGSSVISGWEVGANYSRRKKTSAFKSYFLCPTGAGTDCTVASGTTQFAAIPQQAIVGSVPLGYLGVPSMLALDPLYLYNNSLQGVYDNRPVSLVRDNSVTEKVWTGYAMIKLDGDVGGKKVTGGFGVQVVHTDQSSDGSISNFSNGVVTVIPASGGDKYWRVLPSANLAVEVADASYLKLATSLTMVRPRLDQERVNQEFGIDPSKLGSTDPANSVFSSNGGNSRLRPYKSFNVDASLEHYFPKGGYVSLAGYYKRLTDYVDPSASFVYDFAAAASSLSPAQQAALGTTLGLVKAPNNGGKGNIKGFEATLSLPFSLLTPSLDGFGFFGSGSYTSSKITLASNPGNPITLPGLSDWVANASVYYEKNGFQVRASYRYRSKFLAEVAGLSANPTYRTAKAEGILDAQIGYEFQEGSPLAGLSILVQAKNLTDRPFITYQNDDPRQVIDYQRYGRDYYIGLSYKF